MNCEDPQACSRELRRRLAAPIRRGLLNASTTLQHFALVTYAVPAERLAPHIPTDRFAIETFPIDGRQLALLSVVPFVDTDFTFPRLIPGNGFQFAQTNHRVYIRDRRTGEPAVWFFGTTLGSPLVTIPRVLWSMPWHRAHYRVDCRRSGGTYQRWRMSAESPWCSMKLELRDCGRPATTPEGFGSRADFLLRLTHPITGFFRRLDGQIGRYSIRHPLMRGLREGAVVRADFSLYRRHGIMSREEMASPHCVQLLPRIRFEVELPPRVDEWSDAKDERRGSERVVCATQRTEELPLNTSTPSPGGAFSS